jgi:hypothetical protein
VVVLLGNRGISMVHVEVAMEPAGLTTDVSVQLVSSWIIQGLYEQGLLQSRRSSLMLGGHTLKKCSLSSKILRDDVRCNWSCFENIQKYLFLVVVRSIVFCARLLGTIRAALVKKCSEQLLDKSASTVLRVGCPLCAQKDAITSYVRVDAIGIGITPDPPSRTALLQLGLSHS